MTIGIFKEWLVKYSLCIRLFLKPFLYFNILSITWQLLLSVEWRHLFPWQIKTRPIYGMETNIKSRNGWFKNFMVLAIYQIILHLNKITECLKMTTFKIVFTFDVFLVLKPQCTAKWHVFYIRNRHISVGSFVYKYDKWPHDSYMTGRAGVWEADDIVKFYIVILDFFPATL